MSDINPAIPVLGQPDSTEEPKVVTALTQIIATINDLTADNFAAGELLETGPTVTSLPASPVDGQESNYLVDSASSTIWRMKWRAGSPNADKWEYVSGGEWRLADTDGFSNTAASTWQSTGLTFTAPRPGVYRVVFGGVGNVNANASSLRLIPSVNGAVPGTAQPSGTWNLEGFGSSGTAASPGVTAERDIELTVAAGQTIVLMQRVTSTLNFTPECWMRVRPVRLS